ncbi:hypothetical protein [Rhizobium sp. YTU87027]|uniref:hypothetical protein n=1 Tax=Rhizobium sp. YTU87027 TaxID=3417741 RepID=UPI003D6890B0
MSDDRLSNREATELYGLRRFEIFVLQRHAGFPRGEKRVPELKTSRVKYSRRQIEKWREGIRRLAAELKTA